jgi:hypothetical protein
MKSIRIPSDTLIAFRDRLLLVLGSAPLSIRVPEPKTLELYLERAGQPALSLGRVYRSKSWSSVAAGGMFLSENRWMFFKELKELLFTLGLKRVGRIGSLDDGAVTARDLRRFYSGIGLRTAGPSTRLDGKVFLTASLAKDGWGFVLLAGCRGRYVKLVEGIGFVSDVPEMSCWVEHNPVAAGVGHQMFPERGDEIKEGHTFEHPTREITSRLSALGLDGRGLAERILCPTQS